MPSDRPRTLEEIAEHLWTSLENTEADEERILAALREAEERGRAQGDERLAEALRNVTRRHGHSNGDTDCPACAEGHAALAALSPPPGRRAPVWTTTDCPHCGGEVDGIRVLTEAEIGPGSREPGAGERCPRCGTLFGLMPYEHGEPVHYCAPAEEVCLLCLRTRDEHGNPPHEFASNLLAAPAPPTTPAPETPAPDGTCPGCLGDAPMWTHSQHCNTCGGSGRAPVGGEGTGTRDE
jgi:hypothetical protein